MNWFHQALKFALFGGGGGLGSGEIMGGREWLKFCGGEGRGLVVCEVVVEAEVRPLSCWATLKGGVVCVGVCVCRGGVSCIGLGVYCGTDLVGAGSCTGCCLGVEWGVDEVELLSTSCVVSSDRVAMTVCEFCNGYEFFRTRALAICRTENGSSFRMNAPGIESSKIGVEGNSTAGGVDATDFLGI